MAEETLSIEKLQQLITRGPFNRWLAFTVLKTDDDGIEVKAAWREEWVVNPERRYTHGGILAAIVDVAADYALAARLGRPVPTIDVRVDYHKAAMPGDLTARARVVRMGSQYSTAEASVYDQEGALVASGPFRFSRNPMYLGSLFVGVGAALLAGTWPMWLVPATLVLLQNFVIIPFEERSMERTFGDAYNAYRARVRRWI